MALLYPVFLVDLDRYDENDYSEVRLVALHLTRGEARRMADDLGVTDLGVHYVGRPVEDYEPIH